MTHPPTYRYTKALDSIKTLRKDRTADLKAERERLESLSKEKAHADKLRARSTELNSLITSKQLQYEQTKQLYDELVKNNARFYESATKFRELYVKVESLQQKKEHYQNELAEARETIQEIAGMFRMHWGSSRLLPLLSGSDEELQRRLRNFDETIAQCKQKRRRLEAEREDLEDELIRARKTHVELVNEHGELAAEAKVRTRFSTPKSLFTHAHRRMNATLPGAKNLSAVSVISTSSRAMATLRSSVTRSTSSSHALGTCSGGNVQTLRSSRLMLA